MKQLISRADNKRAQNYLRLKGADIFHEDTFAEVAPVEKKNDELLDVIYGVDPDTGLPCGDIVMYLSKNTSPSVRDYIQRNLMQELPEGTAVPVDESDQLFDYIRQRGESRHEYAERITAFERERVRKVKDSKSK